MSIEAHIYLGPYVRAKVGAKPSQRQVLTCTKKDCGQHRKELWHAKFCPECGLKLGHMPAQETVDAVDDYEIAKEIDERLHCEHPCDGPLEEGFHHWLPNVRVELIERNTDVNDGHSYVEDMTTGLSIDKEITAFAVQFMTELDVLKKAYGARNVELRWGLINCVR